MRSSRRCAKETEADAGHTEENLRADSSNPRDGIPALTDPEFVAAAQADFLAPDDRVLGLNLSGEARAYPIAILNWHEIVNDPTET